MSEYTYQERLQSQLTDLERGCIIFYAHERGTTFAEAARVFDISRQRVHQIYNQYKHYMQHGE